MAAKRKTKKEVVETPVEEKAPVVEEAPIEEKAPESTPAPVEKEKPVKETKPKKTTKPVVEKKENEPKYKIGSIVFVSKDVDADLNGFKLFPQYKKYTYTVEAYDAITGVYSLRRLNLSLKLKEAFIVAPNERAQDSLNRRQF